MASAVWTRFGRHDFAATQAVPRPVVMQLAMKDCNITAEDGDDADGEDAEAWARVRVQWAICLG